MDRLQVFPIEREELPLYCIWLYRSVHFNFHRTYPSRPELRSLRYCFTSPSPQSPHPIPIPREGLTRNRRLAALHTVQLSILKDPSQAPLKQLPIIYLPSATLCRTRICCLIADHPTMGLGVFLGLFAPQKQQTRSCHLP